MTFGPGPPFDLELQSALRQSTVSHALVQTYVHVHVCLVIQYDALSWFGCLYVTCFPCNRQVKQNCLLPLLTYRLRDN